MILQMIVAYQRNIIKILLIENDVKIGVEQDKRPIFPILQSRNSRYSSVQKQYVEASE